MLKQQIKTRLIAAGLHSLFTLLLASTLWVLIFYVWYPAPFDELMGGFDLLYWIIIIDLTLGPTLMFIIFNPKKSKKELVLDISLIISLQIGAMIYGMSVLIAARPAYVAFVKDRFEIMIAAELSNEDLAQAENDDYKTVPWTGPKIVTIRKPHSIEEKNEVLHSSIFEGKDYGQYPKFYQSYDTTAKEVVTPKILPLSLLKVATPEEQQRLDVTLKKLQQSNPQREIGWTLLRYRTFFGTVLLDKNTAEILAYLPVEPLEEKVPEPSKEQTSQDNAEPHETQVPAAGSHSTP